MRKLKRRELLSTFFELAGNKDYFLFITRLIFWARKWYRWKFLFLRFGVEWETIKTPCFLSFLWLFSSFAQHFDFHKNVEVFFLFGFFLSNFRWWICWFWVLAPFSIGGKFDVVLWLKTTIFRWFSSWLALITGHGTVIIR